jgi:hypothetical protein
VLQQRKYFKTRSTGRLAPTVIGAAIGENTAKPTIAYDDTRDSCCGRFAAFVVSNIIHISIWNVSFSILIGQNSVAEWLSG